MYSWLNPALDYIPRWIEFQVRQSDQPGCAIAIAYKGEIVLEQAFGRADLSSGEPLTPRHRFRVASHSKSFTAAGIMKLQEKSKLHLDDAVGRHVDALHPSVAKATIGQLLSHSAGIIRDGTDRGQRENRRPFPIWPNSAPRSPNHRSSLEIPASNTQTTASGLSAWLSRR
jgi:D-alanyl-D-alanine carboxypeptidase